MPPTIQKLLAPLIHVLMPRRCLHCAASLREAAPLCLTCFRLLETCRIPAAEVPGVTAGGRLVRAVSYYRAGSPLRAVHRAAKYHQHEGCARWMSRYMLRRLDIPEGVDICIPVPSHPARLVDRGLDIVHILAQELAGLLKCACRTDLLVRTKLGIPQNELNRTHRLANVRAVFSVGDELHEPARILLVDDVVTTGATLDACASLLEAFGHTVMPAALALRRELF